MSYLLMSISIMICITNSTLLHKFSNKGLRNAGDLFLYNAGMNAVWVVIIALFGCFTGGLKFDRNTIIFGIVYAIILCLFTFFKMMAYASGPVALTTLIASSSFLITTAYTYFFEKQPVSLWQLIGIIILVGSLFLCVNPREHYGEEGGRITLKWVIFVLIFFIAGGGIGIIYKYFGQALRESGVDPTSLTKSIIPYNSMIFTAAAISALGFLILGFVVNGAAHHPKPHVENHAIKYMLICGATSCIYIRMNISLANMIPSVIFFPVNNGVVVLAAAVLGWIIFREMLNKKQILGITLGIVGMIIIGVLK